MSQPPGLGFVKGSPPGPLSRLGQAMNLSSLAESDLSGMHKPQRVKAERIREKTRPSATEDGCFRS